MPAAHRAWKTTIRISDFGSTARILPHRLLELMQEAAAYASTAGGYPPERYLSMNAAWFIREIRLAIDAPLAYGDEVVVKTWISSLRRFRSRREYVVSAGGRVAARGQAEWLFLEQAPDGRVRPRVPDEAMFAAFPMGEGVAIPEDEVLAFPEPPQGAASGGASYAHVVRPTEIDRHRHVNNVRYLGWLDDHGRIARPEQEIVAARLEYLLDARLGDHLALTLHETPGADLQLVDRGEQRVMRAAVRRVPADRKAG